MFSSRNWLVCAERARAHECRKVNGECEHVTHLAIWKLPTISSQSSSSDRSLLSLGWSFLAAWIEGTEVDIRQSPGGGRELVRRSELPSRCLFTFVGMDQHSKNVESSDAETSLSYSLEYSDTDSLVESVGSVGSASREMTPEPRFQFRRRKKEKASGPQFLEFSKQLPDVPVSAAWEFIRNHRNMSDLVPGVIGHFDYLEGDGSTGSVFIANYSPYYNPDEKYVVNKVEVRDDVSHMYAVRCVGGRYQKRYPLYFTFIKVVPDAVLGEGSSSIIWRLQYELLDPLTPIPHETKLAYTTAIDLIRDRHLCLHRVQRPLVGQGQSATLRKRSKRQAARQRRLGADQQSSQPEEVEDPSEPKRKPRVLVLGLDRDDQKKQRPRGKSMVQLELVQGNDDFRGLDRDGQKNQRPKGKSMVQVEFLQGNDDFLGLDRDGLKKQRPRGKSMVQLELLDGNDDLLGLDRDGENEQWPRGKSMVQLEVIKGSDGEEEDRDVKTKQMAGRNLRIVQSQMKDCEEVDEDGQSSCQNKESPIRKASNELQAGGSSGVSIRSKGKSRMNARGATPQ